jgi:hypothetical protein
MRELALHLLDLAENSVAADARTVSMRVEEDAACDRLRLTLVDDGRGMTPDLAARVTDAFVTSRTERKVGLGLPLLKAAAEFQRSHLDRMPLGDLAGTWLTLLVTHPQVHWSFEYSAGAKRFVFNDAALKHELGGVPLTDPAVLRFLRPLLVEGVAGVGRAATPPLPVGPTGEKLCQS